MVAQASSVEAYTPITKMVNSSHAGQMGNGWFAIIALAVQGFVTSCLWFAEIDLTNAQSTNSSSVYNYYVGVALMMFVGFGYLMTFLKAYGLGAVGFTMFITCMGVEFAIIVESLMGKGNLHIDFLSLLNGNFAVAAVLISFGALIGKVSPFQVSILTVLELFFYCVNKVYVLGSYGDSPLVTDCGGTIVIHVFGAYFGLACATVLGPPADHNLNGSSYVSDLFSLVGTVFLWLFWPSFVAGALPGGDRQTTALINTVLALLSSTVVTFGVATLLNKGKISTVAIQNATLAGGVAIGATANIVHPFAATVLGGTAGAISTVGFLKPPLFSSVDTCGIHNLHGMPGLFGGLFSVAVPILYPDTLGVHIWSQSLGLVATLAVACLSGAATGVVLKFAGGSVLDFSDAPFWDAAEDIPKP